MPPLAEMVVAAFLIFARVGACLLIMPGISSPRIPMQIRLFLALACSLMIVPLVMKNVAPAASMPPLVLMRTIIIEIIVGGMIGVLARIYFWALQFMASVIAMAAGYSGAPSGAVEAEEPQAAIATFVTLSALCLFFISDLHMEVFRALLSSYSAVPVDGIFQPDTALTSITDTLSRAFLGTIRIAAPFIVFAIVVNIAVGLINKLTPTIPVYFISMPFVLAGALMLLYFAMPDMLRLFTSEIGSYLRNF
ncbi:flagellar biosynthetic protein FliR [Phyllobacterium sp. 0TCS1.6C]|uniref:flagellar biosynthetic protein FliR n=1 Tax=unclassified Phyllobacterium TaxID=2638441 RepID=UPI002263B2B6|nr:MULTISPECIES: flagellar biosynthetic protein FliR [unclassified Phyllobacterium]MCX8280915.1 flagellar biosynthetic protein FliR [Phyllobacterium sp. 0TCS1.6C]MCX8295781.1 flagellar biosynthetic protein FliR [Phyllobacterium sp. 0TCS1.6A]